MKKLTLALAFVSAACTHRSSLPTSCEFDQTVTCGEDAAEISCVDDRGQKSGPTYKYIRNASGIYAFNAIECWSFGKKCEETALENVKACVATCVVPTLGFLQTHQLIDCEVSE